MHHNSSCCDLSECANNQICYLTESDNKNYGMSFPNESAFLCGNNFLHDNPRKQNTSYLSVKETAKKLWSKDNILSEGVNGPTTYSFSYTDPEIPTGSTNRPTSPTRKNNPHPTPAFLTYHLHQVPGYYKASTVLHPKPYRTDGVVSADERARRLTERAKYFPLKDSKLVNQQKLENTDFEDILSREDKHATEAWMQLAHQKESQALQNILHRKQLECEEQATLSTASKAYEQSLIDRVDDMLNSNPRTHSVAHHRIHQMPGISSVNLPRYKPKAYFSQSKLDEFQLRYSRRGDFLLHPDWPAYYDRHYLPCLH